MTQEQFVPDIEQVKKVSLKNWFSRRSSTFLANYL